MRQGPAFKSRQGKSSDVARRQPLGFLYCVSVGTLVGIITAIASLDFDFFFGDGRLVDGMRFDAGSSFAGLRYFINDGWHWPLLETTSLSSNGEPAIIALTDSLPLLALPAKLLRPLGISTGTWIGLWYYGSFAAQGLSAGIATYTHRALRRWTPLALAVLACNAPVLFLRIWHPGLFAQFSLLLTWAARGWIRQKGTTAATLVLLAPLTIALLTHPYIFLMSLAVASATMLDAVFSKVIDLRQLAIWLATAATTFLVALFSLGYLPNKAVPPGGYGAFPMHVVSPFWPQWSRLWPGDDQLLLVENNSFEGVNYLGAGAALAVALALIVAPRRFWRFLAENQATVIAMAALTATAITSNVYLTDRTPVVVSEYFTDRPNARLALFALIAGTLISLVVVYARGFRGADFRPGINTLVVGATAFIVVDRLSPELFPEFLAQFRASGRLFWVVGYGLMLGALMLLDQVGLHGGEAGGEGYGRAMPTGHRPPRPALFGSAVGVVVVLLAVAQGVDTTRFRSFVPTMLATTEEDAARMKQLADLVQLHESIQLQPDWYCTDSPEALIAFQEVVIAGSLANVAVDSYYGGRTDETASCPKRSAGAADAGQLVAIVPPLTGSFAPPATETSCRGDELLILCSARWDNAPSDLREAFPPLPNP